MKNLLILHLESITRQRLSAFESSFPHTRRLLRESLVFDHFHSSATSTMMVVTYLFHGNDFEFDRASEFEGMRPAANNRNLFSILADRGYRSHFICLNAFHTVGDTKLASWPDELPPVWGTNDFPTLFARFDELTDGGPFAIYVWDLITHIEHSQALAPYSSGLTDQVRRACAVADDAIGTMLATLERKGLLENTTIVVYGDHGDDFWTHGFKSGMVHATEPYTSITWTPLGIRDPDLEPGTNTGLASTIDLAPTCLSLLGLGDPLGFAPSGTNLLAGAPAIVYSQNFTANQPDNRDLGLVKAFAAQDDTYLLVVSSRGLELYAYHLDPGNHCNLLHFFDLRPDGSLAFRPQPDAVPHFRAALQDNPGAVADLAAHFASLRAALAGRIAAKRDYIVAQGAAPAFALDPRCLSMIATAGRAAFFGQAVAPEPPKPMPAFNYSFRIR